MHAKLLLTGSEKDSELVNRICLSLKSCPKPIILTGKMTLKQLLALMKRINVFISADSGPLHIAKQRRLCQYRSVRPDPSELTLGPRGKRKALSCRRTLGAIKGHVII